MSLYQWPMCPHGQIEGQCHICEAPPEKIWHCCPTFGREHVTDQRDKCWCQPTVTIIEGGLMITHKVEQ